MYNCTEIFNKFLYSLSFFLIQAIMKIKFIGGRTNIADALNLLRTQLFNGNSGDRPDVQVYN